MNISTLLEMAAEAFPDRTAVVAGKSRLSYSQLRAASLTAAAGFKQADARYVALLDVNSLAAPIALFGAAAANLPYVPLNYRLTDLELDDLMQRIASAVLIVGEDQRARLNLPDAINVIDRAVFLASAAQPIRAIPEDVTEDNAAAVQLFTSGTTGKPKAAILRHENLLSYILGTVEFGSADETEASLVTVPPYHIAGISALLSSVYAGRRIVLLENFEPAAWLTACESERVTNAFLVPTMLGRIVDTVEGGETGRNLQALRAIAFGGGKMPASVVTRAMALFPSADFTNAYGLTETSSTICLLNPEDHRSALASDDPSIRKRLGSVGRALDTVELQIRDDVGNALPTGISGQVFVRGGQVAGEYLDAGSTLDADGWFYTRDRGYLDAGNYLFLEGRADDVIVRGGENISPGEIEDILIEHPAVRDAAVVAVPDEQWGETVGAAIVLNAHAQVSVAELQGWVRARLRSSRVPARIEFRTELPYNELGKVLRRVIRQELESRP
jgi:long-chain acyl-CoA synthetase